MITEIKGLESLTNLRNLFLNSNKIEEIKGLETLTRLQTLYLDHNQIKDIKALAHLKNLQKLHLFGNPITDEDLADLMDEDAEFDAQKIVRYCKGKTNEVKII